MATVENKAFLLAAMIRRLAGFAFCLVTAVCSVSDCYLARFME
jgi:hypothetical protein